MFRGLIMGADAPSILRLTCVASSAEELVEGLQDAHSNLTNLIATLPCNNIKI